MKRWLSIVACGLLLTGCSAGTGPGPSGPSPAAPQQSVPQQGEQRGPEGRLAYTRDGKVYTYEGAREREIGPGHTPRWSPDGQWLAYISDKGRLRLVKPDGTAAASPDGLPAAEAIAWSPARPLLAVGTATGLWIVQPGESPSELVADPRGIRNFMWSPDGRRIAYATTELKAQPPPADTLWIIPAEGGTPAGVIRDEQSGLYVAAWWPDGQGLLYWLAPMHSASLAADGMPLQSLPLGGGAPRRLTTMLGNSRWISRAPDGKRFLVTAGGGRQAWIGKSLAVCDPQSCTEISQPAGTVSFDGTWAPAGDRIAFVRAEARPGTDSGQGWLQTRTLWVSRPDGSEARSLAQTNVHSPMWARDGRHLLYVKDDGLWWIDLESGVPIKIAGLTQQPGPGYYGQIAADVAWYQP